MPPGIFVAAVLNRSQEIAFPDSAFDAIAGHRFRRGVHLGREQRLDTVRHRVHAGCRRQSGRQAQGQVWVAHGGAWDQVPTYEDPLFAIGHDDDSATRNLATRARRGGDGDQRSDGADLRSATETRGVFQQVPFVRHRQRYRLGQIHRGAAAESDDPIAPRLPIHRGRFFHGRLRGVFRCSVKDGQ